MELRRVAFADFETDGIDPRPKYPPRPVGLAVLVPGRRPFYHAWGHPTENNSSKSDAMRHLETLRREGYALCWHHAGFDLDVAETHCGVTWPATHHDTLLLAFLHDPRSPRFSLKPLAERHLGEPPTERDELRDWIVEHVPEARRKKSEWGRYICRAPGGLVGRYACGDVTRTRGLFELFKKSVLSDPRQRVAYERELKLTRVLIRMERRGVPVATRRLARDVPRFEQTLTEVEAGLFRRLRVPKRRQEEFTWNGDAFADVLERAGAVKEWIMTEPSKTHPEGQRATGVDSLREVGVDETLVKELEVRAQLQTCLSTFMRPWLAMGRETGGRFYARFNQTRQDYHGGGGGRQVGTATGRLSMTPNLQNVARKKEDPRVPALRDYVVPGERSLCLIKRDYSQQELRILAHEEGAFALAHPEKIAPLTFQNTFLYQYQQRPEMDAHQLVREMIQLVVGLSLERRAVKDLNFGLIYGMGLNKLALKLMMESKQARLFYNAHMKALPVVSRFKGYLKELAAANEPVYTWGGRRYYVEPAKQVKGRWMDFWYKLLNIIVQGGAADCTKQAMVNYHEMGHDDDFPLILQVHDELLALAPVRHYKRAHDGMNAAMSAVEFSVPMLSDGGWSTRSWLSMKEVQ